MPPVSHGKDTEFLDQRRTIKRKTVEKAMPKKNVGLVISGKLVRVTVARSSKETWRSKEKGVGGTVSVKPAAAIP